jgi:hypothetical protein
VDLVNSKGKIMSCDHEWLLTIEDDELITTANEPLHKNTTQSGNATAQMQSGNATTTKKQRIRCRTFVNLYHEPLPKPRISVDPIRIEIAARFPKCAGNLEKLEKHWQISEGLLYYNYRGRGW